MAKGKFDILTTAKKDKVVDAAALKENDIKKEKEFVDLSLKKFPKELWEAIRESGEPVNTFIKRAAKRLAKEEEILWKRKSYQKN